MDLRAQAGEQPADPRGASEHIQHRVVGDIGGHFRDRGEELQLRAGVLDALVGEGEGIGNGVRLWSPPWVSSAWWAGYRLARGGLDRPFSGRMPPCGGSVRGVCILSAGITCIRYVGGSESLR